MESDLGWGWSCECLEFNAPLDLDAMISADDGAEDNTAGTQRGRRTGPQDGPGGRRKQVCKHWLRGLCMKGDRCDFLHVYDPARMPVCHMYATYGECASKDCIFAHRAVDERSDECVFYNRGFCKHGATCRLKHVRRQPCPLYLQGFCPEGPDCQYGHPKFELPDFDGADGREPEQPRHGRGLENVTCYKCWRRGHYASACANKRIPQPPAHLLARTMGTLPNPTAAR